MQTIMARHIYQLFLLTMFTIACSQSTTVEPAEAELDGYTAAANFIKLGMNPQADACDNFYEFTCGNIKKNLNTSDYSSWSVVSANFTRKIIKLLNKLQPSQTSIPKVSSSIKKFWKQCLNRREDTAIRASAIDAIELTKDLGGAPLFDDNWKDSGSIFANGMEAQKRFGVQFGMTLQVGEDSWSDVSRNVMYINLNTELEDESAIIDVHSKFAELAGKTTVSQDKMTTQKAEMEEARIELRKLKSKAYESGYGYSRKLITLRDLYDQVPDLASSFSDEGVNNASHIYMWEAEIEIVKSFLPVLSKYSKYRRALQNYLIGAYLIKASQLLDISPGTTINITESDSPPLYQVSTSHDDPTYDPKVDDIPENLTECLEIVATGYNTGYFEYAVLRLFVDTYGPSEEEALKLRQLVDLTREELRRMVYNANWLDYHSKIRTMNKLSSVIPRIVYPLWIVNNTALNAYFNALGTFSDSDSYLKLLSKAHGNKWKNQVDLANRPVAQDYNSFGMSSFYVNAWYQGDRNAFALTLGILQPPFYRPDYPPSLIYGIVAAITGHEIVHGFDKSGVQRDLEGKQVQWMSADSYSQFLERAKCVEDQYEKFCYNLSGSIMCLDGSQTASENIADLGGLKAAYRAYKSLAEDGNAENTNTKLPGLESYSWDQILFMGYGAAWCLQTSDSYLRMLIYSDSHSPGPSRVNGTLQNMPNFAESFNCPFNTKMNPTNKCHIW